MNKSLRDSHFYNSSCFRFYKFSDFPVLSVSCFTNASRIPFFKRFPFLDFQAFSVSRFRSVFRISKRFPFPNSQCFPFPYFQAFPASGFSSAFRIRFNTSFPFPAFQKRFPYPALQKSFPYPALEALSVSGFTKALPVSGFSSAFHYRILNCLPSHPRFISTSGTEFTSAPGIELTGNVPFPVLQALLTSGWTSPKDCLRGPCHFTLKSTTQCRLY
jgi:hypothetical protein